MSPIISVAIPTYMREQTLLNTIDQLLSLESMPAEILIVDQTPVHKQDVEKRLETLASADKIRWFRLDTPSIPKAMNHALVESRGAVVLFLDDDIELISEIVAAHAAAHQEEGVTLVAGQVIQSWQDALSEEEDSYAEGRIDNPDGFLFNSARKCWITRFMGGNFSIKKEIALQLGGFDENFVKVAYRFEAEFADRLQTVGHRILFFPKASIRHLKAEGGGTRSFGEHLTTIMPSHSVGRYYYLLAANNVPHRMAKTLTGPFRAVKTRFHLSHPWWIPISFLSECGGILWALWLYGRGPRYVREKDI